MSFIENGLINKELWHSKEWENFYMKNINLMSVIVDVFKKNKHPFTDLIHLSTQYIADTLNKNPKYIHQLLAIWARYRCTFYKKYGTIEYNSNMWFYISKK